jgi:hypothetical protein
MSEQAFELLPFSAASALSDLKIGGSVGRDRNILKIRYSLMGPLETVAIPQSVDEPSRKHELWEETCFEFFLGVRDTSKYWEFNLSPAGHWNIYRFDNYRHGMQEEAAIASLPFSVEETIDSLLLVLELNLDQLVPADRRLEMAISTVIKTKDSAIGYCALTHPGAQADFHRRDSFAIEL